MQKSPTNLGKHDSLVAGARVRLYHYQTGSWICGTVLQRRGHEWCESWRSVSLIARTLRLTRGARLNLD